MGRCAYRGPDGLQCAIGCLIPDRLYDPKMEGNEMGNIVNLMVTYPKLRKFLGKKNDDFLLELQRAHDFDEVKSWKSRLRSIAKRYRLSSKVLDKF